MNRDEERSREPASRLIETELGIYPLDPRGQGTWIYAFKNGSLIALMNHYSQRLEPRLKEPRSRGEIPLRLAELGDFKALHESDLKNYLGFRVFLISFHSPTQELSWDGEKVRHIEHPELANCFVSSSEGQEEAVDRRVGDFQRLEPASLSSFLDFHLSQHEEIGRLSVLVEREKVASVSLSQLVWQKNEGWGFFYLREPVRLAKKLKSKSVRL